jgi:hypothetical protein
MNTGVSGVPGVEGKQSQMRIGLDEISWSKKIASFKTKTRTPETPEV